VTGVLAWLAPFRSRAEAVSAEERIASATQLRLTWWRFRKHRVAVWSGILVAIFYTAALFADTIAYSDPQATDSRRSYIPPQAVHLWDADGSLRPWVHGLKGKRIPLNARIIATADTYDSITSSRAYRAGLPHEFALREMRRVAGSQLDPEVFEVFLGLCAAEPEWLQRFHIKREPEPQPTGAG